MSNKTLIIGSSILLIVALSLYLYLSGFFVPTYNDLSKYYDNYGPNNRLDTYSSAKKLFQLKRQAIKNTSGWYNNIKEKARNKGNSVDNQLTMDTIYTLNSMDGLITQEVADQLKKNMKK